MPDDPSLGEVMRRIDEVSRQLLALAKEMSEDRKTAAQTYLRVDFFNEARLADRATVREVSKDVAALEEERTRNANFRKQMSLGFGVAALGLLGSFGLTIFNLIVGGGS